MLGIYLYRVTIVLILTSSIILYRVGKVVHTGKFSSF